MKPSSYFRIALQQAMLDPLALPSLVNRGKMLRRIVKAGETRREAALASCTHPIPRTCIFSITWKCNLSCKGCYAKNYQQVEGLDQETITRVIREATGLGTYLWIIAGGEPLMVEKIIPELASIENAFFFLFTNGTLLNTSHLALLADTPTILPVISLEGDEEQTDQRRGNTVGRQIRQAMARLKKARIPFGFSVMVTHANVKSVTSRAWFDTMWHAGARFGFCIDYIPFAHDLNPEYVLTDADRAYKNRALAERKREARPLIFNLPPDEYAQGGCASAGKGFMHINADGYV
ncbi:MAG TPA: radical SAM protein, partial [bacterium]|nr:radical SAM protein [bacterium]